MGVPPSIRIPTQRRAVRTRAALVDAAQREFSTRGYAATTARTVAEAAGVSTGCFYQYFSDKDAALRELGQSRAERIGREIVALLGAPDPDVREVLRQVVDAVVDYHAEDPGLHAVLTERRVHDPGLEAITASAERQLIGRVAELLRGWGHPGDPEATAFIIHCMVEGSVHARVLGPRNLDDARFRAALVDAVLRVAVPSAS